MIRPWSASQDSRRFEAYFKIKLWGYVSQAAPTSTCVTDQISEILIFTPNKIDVIPGKEEEFEGLRLVLICKTSFLDTANFIIYLSLSATSMSSVIDKHPYHLSLVELCTHEDGVLDLV